MRIVIPPLELHAGQRAILDDPARFKVASCGRRFGKTMLAVEWLALEQGGQPTVMQNPTLDPAHQNANLRSALTLYRILRTLLSPVLAYRLAGLHREVVR